MPTPQHRDTNVWEKREERELAEEKERAKAFEEFRLQRLVKARVTEFRREKRKYAERKQWQVERKVREATEEIERYHSEQLRKHLVAYQEEKRLHGIGAEERVSLAHKRRHASARAQRSVDLFPDGWNPREPAMTERYEEERRKMIARQRASTASSVGAAKTAKAARASSPRPQTAHEICEDRQRALAKAVEEAERKSAELARRAAVAKIHEKEEEAAEKLERRNALIKAEMARDARQLSQSARAHSRERRDAGEVERDANVAYLNIDTKVTKWQAICFHEKEDFGVGKDWRWPFGLDWSWLRIGAYKLEVAQDRFVGLKPRDKARGAVKV